MSMKEMVTWLNTTWVLNTWIPLGKTEQQWENPWTFQGQVELN